MKKKDKNIGVKPQFERKIDESFFKMDQRFVQGSEFVYILSIILLFFGIMGLIWMIPFPELDFLVSLNMQNFLNWGSFYIAIVIYFYLRLAPTLSYAVLFTIGVMSFLIVQLEYVERAGGPAVWLVSLLFIVAGFVGLLLNSKKETPSTSWSELGSLITLGPIWYWSKVFKRFNIKY